MADIKGGEGAINRERLGLEMRLKQEHEFNAMKRKYKDESEKGVVSLNHQFTKADLSQNDAFKSNTVGLVTAKDFRHKNKKMRDEKRFEIRSKKDSANNCRQRQRYGTQNNEINQINRIKSKTLLSFGDSESEGEKEQETSFRGKAKGSEKRLKNPDVNTSFLPDKEKDEKEEKQRMELRRKWLEMQEKIKEEYFELRYSFWDGSGHMMKMEVRKGETIRSFLHKVKETLEDRFSDISSVAVDDILYIKGDFIIPPNYTFYTLIATKAKGKNGLLFNLQESISENNKSNGFKNEIKRLQTDEARAGKVVTRQWYERNIHMYPASQWKNYDENKKKKE